MNWAQDDSGTAQILHTRHNFLLQCEECCTVMDQNLVDSERSPLQDMSKGLGRANSDNALTDTVDLRDVFGPHSVAHTVDVHAAHWLDPEAFL